MRVLRRTLSAADDARIRLNLGLRGVALVLCGVATLAGSLAVFAGATEDVTRHNGLALRDADHLRIFTSHRTDSIVSASKMLTGVGAIPMLALLVVVSGWFLWYRGVRLAVAFAPAVSLACSAIAAGLTKSIVGRSRPPVSLHLVSESDASFPSGHATNSTAVLLTIAFALAVFVLRRPMTRLLAVVCAGLLAGGIGASRLVLGVHWPSDVIAGLALGLSVAVAVTTAAALVARLTPPPSRPADGRVRRFSLQVVRWLAVERIPSELQAA